MHVHTQSARRRDLAEDAHRLGAFGHRALEMRNAADDVDALVERAHEVGAARPRERSSAVLRKGDELQVEIGRDALATSSSASTGHEPRIADVDMRAYREKPLPTAQSQYGERAFDDGVRRQRRLQLAPQRDAFEQRSDALTRGSP